MAILTTGGRAALAKAVQAQALHLAWGSGDPAWDTTAVPEPVSAAALVAEVGRRTLTSAQYCYEDSNGSISVPSGRYSPSATPTNSLYLRFTFDNDDAPSASIRELGLFIGTTVKAGLPPGQQYFTPDQLDDPGTLLALQRIGVITRSAATRQSFEFVLTL